MRPRIAVVTGLILVAAVARIIPHPPNFAPVAAIALFGGAYYTRAWVGFLVPLAAMAASDLVIGFTPESLYVYTAFAAIVGIGLLLRSRRRPLPILAGAVSGSLLFFFVTNFGSFMSMPGVYPRSLAGLMTCYEMGIPFFRPTLLADLLYGFLLFGGFEALRRGFPALACVKVPAPAPAPAP